MYFVWIGKAPKIDVLNIIFHISKFQFEESTYPIFRHTRFGTNDPKDRKVEDSPYFGWGSSSVWSFGGRDGGRSQPWQPWVGSGGRCLDLDDTSNSTSEALASELKRWLQELQNSEARWSPNELP